MSYNNEFVNRLSTRLSNDGFSTQRGVKYATYNLDLVATKVELSGFRGNRVHVIVATPMETPSTEEISSFSESAYQYVKGDLNPLVYAAGHDPVKGRINLYVVPVTVSNDFSDEIKKWISNNIPAKHTIPFNYPILMMSSTGQILRCHKTPLFGALPWKRLMKYVDQTLGPQT